MTFLLFTVSNLQALLQDSYQPKYVTQSLTQDQFKAVCISDPCIKHMFYV